MTTPPILQEHLRAWLGAWPPPEGVAVVGSPKRDEAGWDNKVHALIGVATPTGAVLSVPPARAGAVARLVNGLDLSSALAVLARPEVLANAMGRVGGVFGQGMFRFSTDPTPGADPGEWVAAADERVPAWLKPFGGDVLVAWDEGAYGAGVGIKRHDAAGHELSVGTEERLRGRGIARLLVAQAARRVLAEGRIPTYLHDLANHASAKVADAAGFPDLGWRVLGLW